MPASFTRVRCDSCRSSRADSLWAELYGVGRTRTSVAPGSERRSLLTYFHGRAKLATWLRSVLAQRHVDRIREVGRLDSLEADEAPEPTANPGARADLNHSRYRTLFDRALGAAVERLDARDGLRLGLYYVQGLTLAQIGRVTQEHEATVSRKLARTRKALRRQIEEALTRDHGMEPGEIELCYQYSLDEGSFDLAGALEQPGGAT